MLIYILARYFHFFAVFGVIATLVIENIAIKPSITQEDAINLAKVNIAFNVSSILTFLVGFTLWLWIGKPSDFYTENPLFVTKIIIFTFILVAGLVTTVFFRSHRNRISEIIAVPPIIIFFLRLQLALFAVALILAFFIARGVGLGY